LLEEKSIFGGTAEEGAGTSEVGAAVAALAAFEVGGATGAGGSVRSLMLDLSGGAQ
jgi:hypothetical protein